MRNLIAPAVSDPTRLRAQASSLPNGLIGAWLAFSLIIVFVEYVLYVLSKTPVTPTDNFFWKQDLPVLGAEAIMLILIGQASLQDRFHRLAESATARCGLSAIITSMIVLVIGIAGSKLIFLDYPLSMDEFMAEFDSITLLHGHIIMPTPLAWRAYIPALQPIFGLHVPGNVAWSSDYLPLNAALRAGFAALGARRWCNPVLSAVSVLLIFDIARNLWPDRRDAAVVVALMLATSSQFLITAMTAYAMPAHLALNLAWLRLYQRNRGSSDLTALALGWAACGLHQLAFHPLFVAPFIIQAWLEGQWRRAVSFALGYGGVCIFWLSYWPIAAYLSGTPVPTGDTGGPHAFLTHTLTLARSQDPVLLAHLMTANLVRFISWQNPLAIALLLSGFLAALRGRSLLCPLAASILLTLAVVTVVMPYQGLGWGYRYMHGLLGAVCLIAGGSYIELTRRTWSSVAASAALWLSVVLSLLGLAPWRAAQAYAMVAPSARASAAIHAASTDFVILDGRDIAFGDDLVRNDPMLNSRPLILDLGALKPAQIEALCNRGRVELFDLTDAKAFKMPTFVDTQPSPNLFARLALRQSCEIKHVTAPPKPAVIVRPVIEWREIHPSAGNKN